MLNPTEDRVIVRKIKETMSEGGIAIPEAATSKQFCAEVIAVGPATKAIKVNDKILFTRAGLKILWKNEELVVLRESEVIATLS